MFIARISTIIFSITCVNLCDAFCVLTSKLGLGAGAVVVLAVLALVAAIAAVIVVVAHPSLQERNKVEISYSVI